MKINGTIFSKPQQDQLKRAIENSGGGGTSLNRYEVTLGELVGNVQGAALLHKIITTAKGNYTVYDYNNVIIYSVLDIGIVIELRYYNQFSTSVTIARATLDVDNANVRNNFTMTITSDNITTGYINSLPYTRIVYFNDTEII